MKLKKIISLILALVMMLSLASCAKTEKDEYLDTDVGQAIQTTGKYLYKKMGAPKYGDETAMISLLRSGYIDYWDTKAEQYRSKLNNFLNKGMGYVAEKGVVYYDKYPDVIFAFTAAGIYADLSSYADLTDVISYDSQLSKGGYLTKIRALTAFCCGDYKIYEGGDVTRDKLADFILSLQQEDGSFSYAGMKETAVKLTSEAVIALSLHERNEERQQAIDSAVEWLSSRVNGDMSLEDLSETIIALNAAGVSARDVNGFDLIGMLFTHSYDDGSYSDDRSRDKGNEQDTALALLALASQRRFDKGFNSLYDMTDSVGQTHNKLSPGWLFFLDYMKIFLVIAICFFVFMLFLSRYRIRKWRKEGRYDEERKIRLDDWEVEERKKQAEAAEKLRKAREGDEEAQREVKEARKELAHDLGTAVKDAFKETISDTAADIKETAEDIKESAEGLFKKDRPEAVRTEEVSREAAETAVEAAEETVAAAGEKAEEIAEEVTQTAAEEAEEVIETAEDRAEEVTDEAVKKAGEDTPEAK